MQTPVAHTPPYPPGHRERLCALSPRPQTRLRWCVARVRSLTKGPDMTDDIQPTRQAIAAKERSGKLTVTGKLKVALDEMLFKGSRRADAAAAAGMTDHGL